MPAAASPVPQAPGLAGLSLPPASPGPASLGLPLAGLDQGREGAGGGREGAPRQTGSTSSTAPRTEAFRLRSKGRGMVEDLSRTLACCGLAAIPTPGRSLPACATAAVPPVPLRASDGLPRLVLRHGQHRASFTGVTRCSSPWACTVCAPSVAAARAEAVRPQVAARMAAGGTAWLVTLTIRHSRGAALPELFAITKRAWGLVTSGREWAEVRAIGAPEYVRGYDYTWSRENGHHLHLHVLLLLPAAHGDGEALAGWFLRRWIEKVRAAGGDALPGAQDARRADSPEAAASYAVTPAACYEAVAMAKKRARSERAGETPFEILRRAVDGDRAAVALWREFVAGTKGRRQVTTSRGLKLAGDEELVDQAEAAEAAEAASAEEADVVAALTTRALRKADRAGLLPQLLDAAEAHAGDDAAVRAAVGALLASLELPDGEWWLLPRSGPPPEGRSSA